MEKISKLFSTVEKLFHFRCFDCHKWWTIGDAPKKKTQWHCPWCGQLQKFNKANKR
ncbi:MAG: hypothetical protein UV57_C0006G0012 [Parcubacteria group bacterium GW2011_GWD2_43_10]|nr:MAG: hypothetical protein UV52_C0001G0003 [Parcubacteria group bacterium GW2011_GWD1_42_9]KKS83797.1 MAG: hypothetical protein UV57_C0006G0012 [Parcubacteria group bacterium GW2011_GWD2_43_10]KKS93662.1 MAG: hypothetical protein UV69_C0005G0021 [Parcubacteria group bacterium GW2011_GWE2_43_12]KKT22181.1 MAG: hypothetical protein UW06_C0016G0004 [Parcubacteria group bacterium GW2011_GWE1_43_8]